jgi:hypothetical protein
LIWADTTVVVCCHHLPPSSFTAIVICRQHVIHGAISVQQAVATTDIIRIHQYKPPCRTGGSCYSRQRQWHVGIEVYLFKHVRVFIYIYIYLFIHPPIAACLATFCCCFFCLASCFAILVLLLVVGPPTAAGWIQKKTRSNGWSRLIHSWDVTKITS